MIHQAEWKQLPRCEVVRATMEKSLRNTIYIVAKSELGKLLTLLTLLLNIWVILWIISRYFSTSNFLKLVTFQFNRKRTRKKLLSRSKRKSGVSRKINNIYTVADATVLGGCQLRMFLT